MFGASRNTKRMTNKSMRHKKDNIKKKTEAYVFKAWILHP